MTWHDITLHYTTLHYTTLHYITLHYMLFASLKTAKFSCSSHIMRPEALADWHFVVGAWWSTAMNGRLSGEKRARAFEPEHFYQSHCHWQAFVMEETSRYMPKALTYYWFIIDKNAHYNKCMHTSHHEDRGLGGLTQMHHEASQDARRKVICPWDFRTTCRVLRNSTWLHYCIYSMGVPPCTYLNFWSCGLAQLASKTCIVLRYGATSGEDPFAKVKGLIDRLGWGEMAVFWTEIQKTNKHRKKKNTEKAEQINAMYCISYLYCLVFLTPECSRDVEWDPKP